MFALNHKPAERRSLRRAPALAVLAAALAATLPWQVARAQDAVKQAASEAAQTLSLAQAWQLAREQDRTLAVARAEQAAAQSRLGQADALWRPSVVLSGMAGVARHDTRMQGAQFSAPGFGQSNGVSFGTSITEGHVTRATLGIQKPLVSGERQVQGELLKMGADMGTIAWSAAQSEAMLRLAERYMAAGIAAERVRLIEAQQESVSSAAREARDRFELGASPVTDTHEADAALAVLGAQLAAAGLDLTLKRQQLADMTGRAGVLAVLPGDAQWRQFGLRPGDPADLSGWLEAVRTGNWQLRQQRQAVDMARQDEARHDRWAGASVDLVAQSRRERLSGDGAFGAASNGETQHVIGVQVSIPLYEGGMRNARKQEALLRTEKSQAELALAVEGVQQQVRAAWLGLDAESRRIAALEKAAQASAARLDATRLGREVGDRSTLDVLNAQNDFTAQRLALAEARVSLGLTRLRLAALAGRLMEDRLGAI